MSTLTSLPPTRRRSGPFTVGGTTFKHLAAAAVHHGISKELARYRMLAGWSTAEVFGLVPAPHSFQVGAMSFPSRSAAAQAHGLSAVTVTSRLHLGWTLNEALTLAPRQRPYRVKAKRLHIVTSPQGTRLRIEKLGPFARAFGLDPSLLRTLASDPSLFIADWRCDIESAADAAVPLWNVRSPYAAIPRKAFDSVS
jgi:hypothetical protein